MTGGDEEETDTRIEYIPNEETWRAKARWNWGSPVMAHECAKVCRTKFYVEQAGVVPEHFTIRDARPRGVETRLSAVDATRRTRAGDPNGWNENVAKIGKRGI